VGVSLAVTLAIGSACSDGVVLITDSLRIRSTVNLITNEEKEVGEIVPGKITQMPEAGLAYVFSGGTTTDVEDFACDDFQVASRAVWREHWRFTHEHPATQWRIEQASKLPEGCEQVEALREATACDVLAASLKRLPVRLSGSRTS
jgi:hypothetical protein